MTQLGRCAVIPAKCSIAPPTRPLFAGSGRGITLSPFGARSYCRKCTAINAKGSIAPTQPLFVSSGRGITAMSPFGARSICRREMFFPEKRLAKVSCASSDGVAFRIRSIISKSIDVLLAIWAVAGFTYNLSKAVASVKVGGVASLPVTYSNESSLSSPAENPSTTKQSLKQLGDESVIPKAINEKLDSQQKKIAALEAQTADHEKLKTNMLLYIWFVNVILMFRRLLR